MKAAAIIRAALFAGSVLFLTACNAPHSEEVGGRTEAPDAPPVHTIALVASNQAVKLEGIATVLNIRSATVAANFSHGQLERFKASTMLSKQMLESAVRQEGIDASQLKLLSTRIRQSWGDKAPFLDVDCPSSVDD